MKNAEKTHSRVRGIFMLFFLLLLPGIPALQAGIPLLIDPGKPTRQHPGPSTVPARPAQDLEDIYLFKDLNLFV